MRRHIPQLLVVIPLAALLVTLCQSAHAQAERELTLEGRVRTNQGIALPGSVSVQLQTDSGMDVAQQLATPEGQFSFPSVPKSIYIILVAANGFEPYRKTLDLTLTGDFYFLDVYLTPINPQERTHSIPPSRTDSEAPRKARKEEAKGAKALAQKKFAAAKTHLEKAVKIFPCYARAQASLALVMVQDHHLSAAEAALRKGIHCDPDFVNSYSELGQILTSEKRYREGKTVLQQGIRRAPAAWQFYYLMGVADLGIGQLAQAETELLKVKDFNTNPPSELYVRLSDVYLDQQEYPKAYKAFQDYLQADPHGKYAEKIRTSMQRMLAAGVLKTPAAMIPPSPKPDP